MDWNKHSRSFGNNPNSAPKGEVTNSRRLAVPITPELHKVIRAFKLAYQDQEYSDVAVLKTFIEAGVKMWFTDMQANQQTQEESNEA